jgi:hypothetical protein
MGGEMDVSNHVHGQDPLTGEALISALADLAGLSEGAARREVQNILDATGDQVPELTLDNLRSSLLRYLEMLDQEINALNHSQESVASVPPL